MTIDLVLLRLPIRFAPLATVVAFPRAAATGLILLSRTPMGRSAGW